ncbi:alkyl hydroperoxide reductase subunit c/ thiol specific antioxidant [Lucifera butyrica]|uniref:Alkyl hydroperoxide reductase subunit c/ thiol specific antioxidant n=1 Tax=Lucifera butyrica TaxID=1351585 RepID=A0A498R0A1_9FIRM|nr:thioredoxin domain-containing protein [Lucifera butyrica]VBB04924.1 alkyl hydroperoxide reductase subunit c/ thiol specific antioxidant [Lucifera butyrica]
MTRKPVLEPGVKVPKIILTAVNNAQEVAVGGESENIRVLVCVQPNLTDEVADYFTDYQNRMEDYAAKKIEIIGLTAAAADEVKKLAEAGKIKFPMVSSGEAAASYGIVDNLSAVFVVDQDALIRRVFSAGKVTDLANPAAVLRAVNCLNNTPKPPAPRADDWRMGSPDAPIVFIEYGDYQCTHCGDLFAAIQQVMPLYKDKFQFIFRHFPMRQRHPFAIQAAQAAEFAGAQGKFWEMHVRMFEARNALETENLLCYARDVGLDADKLAAELKKSTYEETVIEEYREAVKHKVKSPPTLFINDILFEGQHNVETLKAKIDGLLACLD